MNKCKGCTAALFGPCHDYCRAEREGLIEEAQRLAAQGGHALGTFEHIVGYPTWVARCAQCGRMVTATLDPQPGQSVLSGAALEESCPVAPTTGANPAKAQP